MNTDGDELNNDEVVGVRRRRAKVPIWAVAVVVVVVITIAAVIAVLALGGGNFSSTPTGSTTPTSSTSVPAPTTDPTKGGEPTKSPVATDAPGRETAPPINLDKSAAPIRGIVVSVESIKSVQGEATQPGEVSGPALSVTVRIDNPSDAPVDLTTAVVTLFYGSAQLGANPISKPAGAAFPRSVAPGQSVSGTFVFEVPTDGRDQVRIQVDLSVADPIVVFEGAVR